MKKTNIIYWIFTGLLCASLLASSLPDLLGAQQAKDFFAHLGYPWYLAVFLSVAKLLGFIAILIPGYPRIKEWAYAGVTFDFIGATYSQIAIGTPAYQWLLMIIWFIPLVFSYIYYHKKLNIAVSTNK
jgi:uncharacterized membrane protein YphA (DoxX/SURF4 family)